MANKPISVVWLRRDLRLQDQQAIYAAKQSGLPILLLFIFDKQILSDLDKDDARITFIHQSLNDMNQQLPERTQIACLHADPLHAWQQVLQSFNVAKVFFARDYEPYARQRDEQVAQLCLAHNVQIQSVKDHLIFEAGDVLKADGKPYTVFTPYKKKWLAHYHDDNHAQLPVDSDLAGYSAGLVAHDWSLPTLELLGFHRSNIHVQPYDLEHLHNYHQDRDYPAKQSSSALSPHLRFGTVSIRQVLRSINPDYSVFIGELIWREFYSQILWYYPHTAIQCFKPIYQQLHWLNDKEAFAAWCDGQTGYPLVDAGMRQLNATGYMHNRVRMVVASFLCKHLLIDWRWGEAYFAKKLLDYDMAANVGNWQWAASTGCDAVPYFRIFNPQLQLKKFDPAGLYVNGWVAELADGLSAKVYPKPIVEHTLARERCLAEFARVNGK